MITRVFRRKSLGKGYVGTWMLLALAAFVLCACATAPISASDAAPVPAERVVAFQDNQADMVAVRITRDAGFMGSACSYRVTVNGTVAAYIRQAEKLTLYLPAGDVILGTEPTGICGGGLVETSAILQPGRPLFFRIGVDQTGNVLFSRTIDR